MGKIAAREKTPKMKLQAENNTQAKMWTNRVAEEKLGTANLQLVLSMAGMQKPRKAKMSWPIERAGMAGMVVIAASKKQNAQQNFVCLSFFLLQTQRRITTWRGIEPRNHRQVKLKW